jgi:phosphorylcholine metabolism protein LicD
LFQSFSDKLGIPLKPEETVEKSVKDALSLSTFKELGFNFAQNNSGMHRITILEFLRNREFLIFHFPKFIEYLFEETSEVKNAIKSEPQSPNAQDFMSSANLVSTSYSESSDSDGQITSSMQDVSESMENVQIEAYIKRIK